MVSGIFLLDFGRYSDNVSENLKRIFKKNIVRISLAIVFWSIFYLYFEMYLKNKFDTNPIRIFDFLFVRTKAHLWFAYMIVGLYFLTPFLQVLVRNLSKKDFELLLIILAIFGCSYDSINVLLKYFLNKTLYFRSWVPEFSGAIIYFLAGFYFSKFEISNKARKWFYFLFFVGLFYTIIVNSALALNHEKQKVFVYGDKHLNTMFVAFGIFIFFKNILVNANIKGKFCKFISYLSSLSFGVYLIHYAVLDTFVRKIGLTTLMLDPVIMIPLLSILVFAVSALLAFIISKIPILRKVV